MPRHDSDRRKQQGALESEVESGQRAEPVQPGSAWWRRLLGLIVPPKGQRNRPTVSGWLLILVAVGIGVAAYNTGSNILFLVLSFVFSLLIVNGILAMVNFKKLSWELRLPSEFRSGERVKAGIFVRNHKRFYSTRAVWFVLKIGKEKPERIYLQDRVGPGDFGWIPFEFSVNHRGREKVRVEGPESTYPFGFLRKQTGSFLEIDLLIWPALDGRPIRLPVPRRTTRAGEVSRRVGAGTDLLHLREYQKGDPIRRIHWKATARTGQLVVRQLADEGTGSYVLHLDCSETLWSDPELFEKFLSRASTLAGELFTENRLNGYIINREEFQQVRHLSDLKELNDRLALAVRHPGRVRSVHQHGNLIRFFPTADGGVGLELAE